MCIFVERRLQSLKRELKGWESMFEREHGHKPTKVHLLLKPVVVLIVDAKPSLYKILYTIHVHIVLVNTLIGRHRRKSYRNTRYKCINFIHVLACVVFIAKMSFK